MPSPDTIPAAIGFCGEPGQQSPDAIGGWAADEYREYREHILREEVHEFARLYGWPALQAQIEAIQNERGRSCIPC